MIPDKVQALVNFIDFLDKNKNEYITRYIPLCDELNELDKQRSILKPRENYKDKKLYDKVQREIEVKFAPIIENIYNPVTSKLKELRIWSGDDVMTSIYNNNIGEILEFQKIFTDEDIEVLKDYKRKYISFRTETNNNFMCLSLVWSRLDEIYKILFDFFKDTKENEFENFEAKIVSLANIEQLLQAFKEDKGKNIHYSIPFESLVNKKEKSESKETNTLKSNYNVFNMGDNINIGDISKNKGQINVGKNTSADEKVEDETAKKAFRWQRRETVITIILTTIGLIIAYFSMNK
ncbi:hypothetical protein J8J42_13010 [Chryseobacterium sp. cx-311]|uniref:hypothetical protein n=1 Tax=Marnyiella aurantia TaxID=2758037 RepID=UPI001AEA81E0|nr:hypothetical protein [Marnyiella aurantia]MBP0613958.1 hypothetical protein [Marnyiella aurantia]